MNGSDAATLLAHVAAFDNRTVSAEQAAAWSSALDERVGLTDAITAVSAHYAGSREWLMPADVNRAVLKIRADRLNRAGTMADPVPLPDQSPADYQRVLAAHRRAVADGAVTPEPAEPFRPLPGVKPGMRPLGQALAELPTR